LFVINIEKAPALDFCWYLDYGVKVEVADGLLSNPFG
jgi:hypothetical protein